ncbi:MAG TPA: hypothetical protein VH413_00490 [Verrucomicrobiae bacterium]|jgi:hypothetical protein|nr:hypothetical protein [Verrucomicrobiae bacterium]
MKFDLRFPIGILFTIYGIMLVGYGAATNSDTAMYQNSSLGININLWWGIVLLVFGLLMLGGALLGRKTPPSE